MRRLRRRNLNILTWKGSKARISKIFLQQVRDISVKIFFLQDNRAIQSNHVLQVKRELPLISSKSQNLRSKDGEKIVTNIHKGLQQLTRNLNRLGNLVQPLQIETTFLPRKLFQRPNIKSNGLNASSLTKKCSSSPHCKTG